MFKAQFYRLASWKTWLTCLLVAAPTGAVTLVVQIVSHFTATGDDAGGAPDPQFALQVASISLLMSVMAIAFWAAQDFQDGSIGLTYLVTNRRITQLFAQVFVPAGLLTFSCAAGQGLNILLCLLLNHGDVTVNWQEQGQWVAMTAVAAIVTGVLAVLTRKPVLISSLMVMDFLMVESMINYLISGHSGEKIIRQLELSTNLLQLTGGMKENAALLIYPNWQAGISVCLWLVVPLLITALAVTRRTAVKPAA